MKAGFVSCIDEVKKTYAEMSAIFQADKGENNNIPLN